MKSMHNLPYITSSFDKPSYFYNSDIGAYATPEKVPLHDSDNFTSSLSKFTKKSYFQLPTL